LATKQPHLDTSLVVVCCCTFSGSASDHCYRCCWFGLLPRRLQGGHSWWRWGEPDNQLQQTHRSSPQGASHTSSTPWGQEDTTLEERKGTLTYVHVLWEGEVWLLSYHDMLPVINYYCFSGAVLVIVVFTSSSGFNL